MASRNGTRLATDRSWTAHYDRLTDGEEAEIEVTVLAVTQGADGIPVMLAKVDDSPLELWSATPHARRAARHLLRGSHVAARIAKCQAVISDRSYGDLRKQLVARRLALRPM